MKTQNISIVGVGGQGTLLASEVVCRVALLAGADVKKSEVHGMAQRGGSVVSQIRIGEKVHSPLIGIGETDLLLAFEKLEALRYAHYLSPTGIAMVNNQEIRPVTVSSGQATWPSNLDDMLSTTFKSLKLLRALDVARELGSVRVVNVVMMGAMANYLPFEDNTWRESISSLVKPRFLELNLKAYDAGKQLCSAASAS